jgi:hypothetical protein
MGTTTKNEILQNCRLPDIMYFCAILTRILVL